MVKYSDVKASNARIATTFPNGLVAVFAGATNGIGENTLIEFARYTKVPKVYFIGRSQEAGDRIKAKCESLNPEGTFIFLKKDTSLIRSVDEVCQEIKARESAINLLFLSTGTLDIFADTSDGTKLAMALAHYTRLRFIHNFLPELKAATGLRRVVSVFTGTKEGPFDINDINRDNVPFSAKRGHAASLVTLGLESIARETPDVSFIHDFPGFVRSGIARDMPGMLGIAVRGAGMIMNAFLAIAPEENGAFHLYFATSARFPTKNPDAAINGVSVEGGFGTARGNDGVSGSGMYCIDEHGESANEKVEALLAEFRQQGLVEKVRHDAEQVWKRGTSTTSAKVS